MVSFMCSYLVAAVVHFRTEDTYWQSYKFVGALAENMSRTARKPRSYPALYHLTVYGHLFSGVVMKSEQQSDPF